MQQRPGKATGVCGLFLMGEMTLNLSAEGRVLEWAAREVDRIGTSASNIWWRLSRLVMP